MVPNDNKPILLAENDPLDAEAARAALHQAGVINPVIQIGDGRDAIDYLKGKGRFSRDRFPFPGILLVGLKMPRVDGFHVLEWVKANIDPWKLLAIVLSAHDEIKHLKLAYALGAHSFLLKPCIPEHIRHLARVHKAFWQFAPGLQI